MVYNFTSREKNILHYLSISETYTLGKQLAAITGVSERTIRDDIKRINQVLYSEELDDAFELVSCHTKGYKVLIKDPRQFKQFMKDLDYDVNTMERELINFREREIRLLAMLMKDVTLYRLSQMLYFSESTIRALIKKSNSTSVKSHYTMKVANGKLRVNGNEISIRIAALKTIYVNPEYKGIPDHIYREIANPEFEGNVYSVLQTIFKKTSTLSVPSLLFQYLSKSLWIAYRRNQFKKAVKFTEDEKRMLEAYDVEFETAEAIVKLLDRRHHYEFLREDIYFLAMILISFGNRRNLMIQEMDNESYALCKFVTAEIMKDFFAGGQLEVADPLMENLSLFFWGFRVRNHFDISRQYMGVTRVKRKLITASEYSRKIACLLETKIQAKISDKEMVFLTVCMAEGLEASKERKRQSILVTSKYGACEAKRYAAQLQHHFHNTIQRIGICELYEIEQVYADYDVILVNDRKLASQDEKFAYYRSYSTVNTISWQTRYRICQICDAYWFYHQLSADCFLTNLNLKSKLEVFRFIAKKLLPKTQDQKEQVNLLLDNDKRLTCECGYRVALIALVEPEFEKNEIYFMILKNAISWNQRFVQNIILLKMKSDLDLQNVEMGLQEMLIDPDKCSLLIGEPNLNTLRKILKVEE
ncbi:BglG family transcription antiterminator [Holdemania massiliensis]|uniref:BglG family transcription antiterminator n=1 Tax=Holdemania massiliensis TaxID=1468449 RepID=UPI002677086E|nr:HTH domain-containing protein [Holdemania massiliensis]